MFWMSPRGIRPNLMAGVDQAAAQTAAAQAPGKILRIVLVCPVPPSLLGMRHSLSWPGWVRPFPFRRMQHRSRAAGTAERLTCADRAIWRAGKCYAE